MADVFVRNGQKSFFDEKRTISTQPKVRFERDYWSSGEELGLGNTKKLKIDFSKEDDNCKKYLWKAYGEIVRYEHKSGLLDEDKFERMADKLEIQKHSGDKKNPKVEVISKCYNPEKVLLYGICETNANPPDNWGFCSRACGVSIRPNELPEETRFIYFEKVPPNTQLASGKQICVECLYGYQFNIKYN